MIIYERAYSLIDMLVLKTNTLCQILILSSTSMMEVG